MFATSIKSMTCDVIKRDVTSLSRNRSKYILLGLKQSIYAKSLIEQDAKLK